MNFGLKEIALVSALTLASTPASALHLDPLPRTKTPALTNIQPLTDTSREITDQTKEEPNQKINSSVTQPTAEIRTELAETLKEPPQQQDSKSDLFDNPNRQPAILRKEDDALEIPTEPTSDTNKKRKTLELGSKVEKKTGTPFPPLKKDHRNKTPIQTSPRSTSLNFPHKP